MFFILKRSCVLLIFAVLLPLITGCSSSLTNASEPQAVPGVPEPKILHDKVELTPSHNASVTKVLFFESDRSNVALRKNRMYQGRFAQAMTRTVYTEIQLDHPQPGKKLDLTLTLYLRENGRTFRIEERKSRVEADWTSSVHWVGAGHYQPGKWRLGTYDVDVHINREKVATGSFEIYQ